MENQNIMVVPISAVASTETEHPMSPVLELDEAVSNTSQNVIGSDGDNSALGSPAGGSETAGKDQQVRRRGRPRKYEVNGNMVAPAASTPVFSSHPSVNSMKRGRGRPRGSGKLQRLSSIETAGGSFIPHVINVFTGEDVVSKIKSFASEGPLAVSILTANGVVSSVDIRQPSGSGSLKYEGRFEILNLGGSFTFSGIGGAFRKTGWINVSLAKTDGRVFGGVLEGEMIAAGPIQLVVGSFKQSIGKDLERVCSAASPNPQTPPSVPGMNVMPAMPRVPDNSDLVGVPIKVAKVEVNKGYASPTSGLMPAANGGTDNISADNQNMGHAMSEPLQPMPDQRTSEISTGAPQS